MGKGALHPRSEIEDWLKQRLVDGFLEA